MKGQYDEKVSRQQDKRMLCTDKIRETKEVLETYTEHRRNRTDNDSRVYPPLFAGKSKVYHGFGS